MSLRTCPDCDRMSAARTCLAGMMVPANLNQPVRCLGFVPNREQEDRRTGVELWPDLARCPSLAAATAFLDEALRRGAMSSSGILDAASAAGIHRRTVQRAAVELGVIRRKTGFRDGWLWALQIAEGDKEPRPIPTAFCR